MNREQRRILDSLKSSIHELAIAENWEAALDNNPPGWSNYSRDQDWNWLKDFLETGDRGYVKQWIINGFLLEDNDWLDDLLRKHDQRISTLFLATGNVQDYTFSPSVGYLPVVNMICNTIIQQPGLDESNLDYSTNHVLLYSLASRIKYLNPTNHGSNALREQILTYENERINDPNSRPGDVLDAIHSDFAFFDRLFSMREINGRVAGAKSMTLVIERAEMLFPSETRDLHRNLLLDMLLQWANSPIMLENRHRVVLLAESIDGLSQYLKSKTNRITLVDIPRPNEDQRLKFLLALWAVQDGLNGISQRFLRYDGEKSTIPFMGGMTLPQLAAKTAGLNFTGLEDLILQSPDELREETVLKVKGKILQEESGGLLELVESGKTFADDVGGLDAVKARLTDISDALKQADRSDIIRRTIPMGILFLGPPGTGKTQVAQAFANECGANFVKLGDFRSMWVGETERNLSKALSLIRTLSPVIVFMDELDQTEGARGESSGDSGVNKRVFGKLLQFMSDTSLRGKVLWIAASNRPDLIDPALKRAGRFDMAIPFFPPEAKEIREILKIHLGRKKEDTPSQINVMLSDQEWDTLVDMLSSNTERYYTGAEVELIVNETIRRAIQSKGQPDLALSDFKETIEVYEPSRVNYQEIIDSTLREISFLDYLPESWHEKRRELLAADEEKRKLRRNGNS